MIDLITKDNSFYALYNEPFGDVLKAYTIEGAIPSMIGMVADAPSPTDKEVTQVAKNVIQFAAQKIEVSGVSGDPKQIVVNAINDIDEQLKKQQLNNGLLCCSVIFIYDGQIYIGGVGDCTIAMSNNEGALRICYDSADEPRPEGVDNVTVAPASNIGFGPEARLGDLPQPYTDKGIFALAAEPSLVIYMFSDGLTKHMPDFYTDFVGQLPEQMFARVNSEIPKNPEQLLDDICFSVFKIPAGLAPISLQNEMEHNPFAMPTGPVAPVPNPTPTTMNSQSSERSSSKKIKQEKQHPQIKFGVGFWILFLMLIMVMVQIFALGYYVINEWEAYKSQLVK